MTQQITIGTRQSKLALWQAEYVADRLRTLHPGVEITLKYFVTQGDRILDKPLPEIGGKGVFTAELEADLRDGQIDLAVHSLKDLPTDMAGEFIIGAIPERDSPYDALISRDGHTLHTLPAGSTVGTSSLRRVAQIKAARPDLNTLPLRGNVPTRIAKGQDADGPFAAIILAAAGLDRLEQSATITEILTADVMLPAPGQGALAVQCRANDPAIRELLIPLNHTETRIAVEAERAFLNALDSGCRLPVAALAVIIDKRLQLTGRVASLDGQTVITVGDHTSDLSKADELGRKLAADAISRGADKLLDAVRGEIGE